MKQCINDRRFFLKKLTGAAALYFIDSCNGVNGMIALSRKNKKEFSSQKERNVVFPFFKYSSKFNVGDYLPKDQGGKFIQMKIFGTENDKQIVKRIRSGILEENYGNPINWSFIDPKELEKSVWLSRFYFLPSFGRLFYLTKDKSYLEEMMQKISQWLERNPPPTDKKLRSYNWRDMQVAWRTINFCWCYFLTKASLTQEQQLTIVNSLRQHAKILLADFGQQPLNEFNHQAHGALAMLYIGILFPQFEEAEQLHQTGIRILSHHLENAFYSDGGNVEAMFGYYLFETHIFRDAFLLLSQNNLDCPPRLNHMLKKMADYISSVAQPSGTMPPINDSYEMPILPTLSIVNEVLKVQNGINTKPSKYFPESQLGVMRSENHKASWYLVAYPASIIGAHAHAGRLAFSFWFNNQPILIDSGCVSYDNPALVSWYRTTQGHNSVLIDGKSDEATSSSHLWAPKRLTKNRITQWNEGGSYLYCQMTSPESEIVNNSVRWRRNLVLVKNKFLLLHDCFVATGDHNYEILFHLSPNEVKKDEGNKTFSILSKIPIRVIPGNPSIISSLTFSTGLMSIEGKSTPSTLVSYKLQKEGLVNSVVLFIPELNQPMSLKIEQKETLDGIGVVVTENNLDKTTILVRNNESQKISVLGYTTEEIVEVF